MLQINKSISFIFTIILRISPYILIVSLFLQSSAISELQEINLVLTNDLSLAKAEIEDLKSRLQAVESLNAANKSNFFSGVNSPYDKILLCIAACSFVAFCYYFGSSGNIPAGSEGVDACDVLSKNVSINDPAFLNNLKVKLLPQLEAALNSSSLSSTSISSDIIITKTSVTPSVGENIPNIHDIDLFDDSTCNSDIHALCKKVFCYEDDI